MADILRIQERFNITGRGLVYTVKYNKGELIHVGDIFYDLQGHRFKVQGIEMFRRITEDIPWDELPQPPPSRGLLYCLTILPFPSPYLCASSILAYNPPSSMSWVWVPCSLISPSWMTRIRSAFLMVERRWAMAMMVRWPAMLLMAD